jgi:hypothetical protein
MRTCACLNPTQPRQVLLSIASAQQLRLPEADPLSSALDHEMRTRRQRGHYGESTRGSEFLYY